MRSYANAEREPDKPGAGLFKNVVNTGQSISGRLAAHYLGRVFVITSFRHSLYLICSGFCVIIFTTQTVL